MSRADLRASLLGLKLEDSPAELGFRHRMVELLDTRDDCFLRSCFPGHFTASALVVSADGGRALLHHHRNLDRWLQFGGHCDGDDDIVRVACREAAEESGIDGLILASRKPFDLDIHEIPANPKREEPSHFHFDVRFVLIAPEHAEGRVSEESHALQWLTPSELQRMPLDEGLQRLIAKWQALLRRRGHNA